MRGVGYHHIGRGHVGQHPFAGHFELKPPHTGLDLGITFDILVFLLHFLPGHLQVFFMTAFLPEPVDYAHMSCVKSVLARVTIPGRGRTAEAAKGPIIPLMVTPAKSPMIRIFKKCLTISK